MKIGNIDLGERPLLLAPMEDVTDIGFRQLCREQGASMVYSEFVAAEALVRNIPSALEKINLTLPSLSPSLPLKGAGGSRGPGPVGIQIYGRDADAVVEAAKIVEDQAHPDVIDLNFGCPVKKVAGKGAGAGMLKNIPLLLEIAERVVKAVNTPVTAKTRLGWDHDNYVFGTNLATISTPEGGWQGADLAERLQDVGIQALTIHGRTRSQMYTGEADWSLIYEVANNPKIKIPIIGNGDITSLEDADTAFNGTFHTFPPPKGGRGVSAVMIGRATFGQPWLFNRKELSVHEKMDILRRQLQINIERKDEIRGILHTRRHLAATPLFKGIPDFRQTRIAMLRANTAEELLSILDKIEKQIG